MSQHPGSPVEDGVVSTEILELEDEVKRLNEQNTGYKKQIADLETLTENLRKSLSDAKARATILNPNAINGISAFDELPEDVRTTAWRALSARATKELT